MELVLVVVALALSGCWAGIRLAIRARREAATLRRLNATLEARTEQRAREIWEREGRPDGRSAEHWQLAQDEIAQEEAAKKAAEEATA